MTSASADHQSVDDLGGRQVHWQRSPGEGPAILLLGGCGVPAYTWDDVAELLVDLDVVRLDRPGLGGTPWPRVLPRLRDEVATLVALAERVGGPVIVVAHSMAGPHAEALARIRGDLVAAVVLTDSSVETEPKEPGDGAAWLTAAKAVRKAMALRPLRVVGSMVDRVMVAAQSKSRQVFDSTTPLEASVYRDRDAIASVIAEQAAYSHQMWDLARLREQLGFPDRPVVVLTAAGDGGQSWVGAQAELARLLRGRQVVVEDSRHLIMLDRPDLVAEAVRAVRREVGTTR